MVSQGEITDTIVSGTFENRGAETIASVEVCVKQGVGFCAGVGPGLWSGVSVMMMVSRGISASTIIFSALKNRGEEMVMPIGTVIN